MHLYRILEKPIITEKTARFEEVGRYVFQVNDNANKIEVKKAFELVYGETPEKVNMYYTQEKTSQRRGLKKKSKKRAVIILPAGKSVDLAQPKK